MLQPRQILSVGEPVKLHDKQGARATSYNTSRLFWYIVCATTLLLSFNAALGAGEAGLGDARVSDDVYPTAAIEINGLTPNGPVLANNAFFGISVVSLGDLDGDGVPDLAVGAEFDNASGTYRGTVHVILMNADGTVKSTSEINGATPNGPVLPDYSDFGTSVASMGDFDGDGVTDLAAGSSQTDTVYIMLMNAGGTVKSTSEINGTTPNGPDLADHDYFGRAMASLGDLDGDGVTDLAVGAYFDNAGGTNKGTVHIMLMNADGTVKSTSEINDLTPNGPVLTTHDHFGAAVASMGDLDGDGVTDLAVGAYGDDGRGIPGDDGRGAVHIMLMNADGTVKSTSEINGTTPNGPVLADNDNFGRSVASMGDFDGDGVTDLVAGIYAGSDAGGINRGAVHIVTLGVVPVDRTSPTLTDIVLDVRTGVLTLTFNEAIDVTPPDNVKLNSIFISGGADETNRTALTGAALSSTSDNSTLTITLTAAQLRLAAALATPQLDIEVGAVRDISAIRIAASEGNPVTVLGSVPPVAPPPAPANLTATSTTDSVTLTWDDPGDDSITGYKILSRIPAVQSSLSVLVADTGSADNTYTVPDLESGTVYVFLIIAISDHGESEMSDSVRVSTLPNSPPVADAGPSQIVRPGDTVTLNGTVSSDPDGHTITYSWNQTSGSVVALSGADTDSPSFEAPATTDHTILTFELTVSDGRLASSDAVNITVKPDGPPTITLSGSANMTIQVGSTYTEPGYTATDNYDGDITKDVTVAGTVDATILGTYTLQYDVTDSSGNAAIQQVRTISVVAPPPPATPTGLQAVSTTTSVTLTWDDPGDDSITGYKILSRIPAVQSSLSVLVADTGSADNTYTVNNLESGTKYAFRVVALSDHGKSEVSKFVSIHTERPPAQ